MAQWHIYKRRLHGGGGQVHEEFLTTVEASSAKGACEVYCNTNAVGGSHIAYDALTDTIPEHGHRIVQSDHWLYQ